MSKGVGDREEGKKGGALGREGVDDAPFLIPFGAFLPPLIPSPFYAYHAGYVRGMFEIKELYLMLSFLVVFFGHLILIRLIAALQMADIKIVQLLFLRKKGLVHRFFFSCQVLRKPESSPLVLLLSKKIADLLHM